MKTTIALLLLTVLFACNSIDLPLEKTEAVKLNQIGYYPESVKQFFLADSIATNFSVVNSNGKKVLKGNLISTGNWDKSGENLLMGDFSKLSKEGEYMVVIDDRYSSHTFSIKPHVYKEALHAAIKSYYFQRASLELQEKHAGIYHRKSGHPDTIAYFHPSTGKTEGHISSPLGWYDAGDYGKYIGNASLTTGQMLDLLELYPQSILDSDLSIPESGNGISDLMDELKYELDWILTMQDDDGGVYHKLTAKHFSGFVMPEDFNLDRYVIGKGTASSLTFSAVLAQASRIYKSSYPEWAATALQASTNAWNWATTNNNVVFTNPEDVNTGEYGDDYFTDDFFWAASELYITTGNEMYKNAIKANVEEYQHQLTNSWKFFVRNNAYHSLLLTDNYTNIDLATDLKSEHLELANELLSAIQSNPYRISLERYEWGSNSDILNQAQILCVAHQLTNDINYLSGAQQLVDYIFGKNATGYSFLTGFGTKQAMYVHHRPSGADNIEAPVPGFVIGGPNADKQDAAHVTYVSEFPAKDYVDVQSSFASNEVCINWNAPLVFVLGYLESNMNK